MKRIIRKKFKKFWKSVINRRLVKYTSRFGLVVFLLAAVLSFGKIQGTNSAFTDTETSVGNTMTAGNWIPTLTMIYVPSSPDGDNNFYKTAPCVTLSAKIGSDDATLSDVDIYYKFSNSGEPDDGDSKYTGTCIPIPDGNPTHFQAIALNHENHDWKSNVVSGQFKVDTICPIVKITNPDDNEILNGSVEVRGTVADANPHHYWMVIEDSSGHQVTGPGTVNDSNNFDGKFFDWDTTTVADGNYKIKLEARDAAGNKCPSQSPVLSDPNSLSDSVDWIDVKVQNTPVVHAGDVVINEMMWMGSQDDDGDLHTADEWIELKNTTGHAIDIKNWNLYGIKNGGHFEFAGGPTVMIPAGGYLLISDKGRSDSLIDVSPDFTTNNIDFENDYSAHGKIILKDTSETTIDETPNPSGSSWPAGKNENHKRWSMERNGDYAGWHTCDPGAMSDSDRSDMHSYWDSDAQLYNCGTPGHANLSKNDTSSSDYDPNYTEPAKANDTSTLAPVDQVPAGNQQTTNDPDAPSNDPVVSGGSAPAVVTDSVPSDQPASSDATPPVIEPKIVTKEFAINLKGKLDVPDGFLADTEQKMKKIELSGEEKFIIDLKYFEIDLSKIKIDKAGKIEISVSDLNLPKDVDLVTAKKDDVVVLITVTEKPKEEPKKEEIKKDDAALPKADSPKADEKKDDSGGSGNGDPNNPI